MQTTIRTLPFWLHVIKTEEESSDNRSNTDTLPKNYECDDYAELDPEYELRVLESSTRDDEIITNTNGAVVDKDHSVYEVNSE